MQTIPTLSHQRRATKRQLRGASLSCRIDKAGALDNLAGGHACQTAKLQLNDVQVHWRKEVAVVESPAFGQIAFLARSHIRVLRMVDEEVASATGLRRLGSVGHRGVVDASRVM